MFRAFDLVGLNQKINEDFKFVLESIGNVQQTQPGIEDAMKQSIASIAANLDKLSHVFKDVERHLSPELEVQREIDDLKKEIQRKELLIEKSRQKTKMWNQQFQKNLNVVWNHNQTIADTNKKQTEMNGNEINNNNNNNNNDVKMENEDSSNLQNNTQHQNSNNAQNQNQQEELLNSDQEMDENFPMPDYDNLPASSTIVENGFETSANNLNLNGVNGNGNGNGVVVDQIDLTDEPK